MKTDMSTYFTEHGPEIEKLQPIPANATYERTETQYIGFQIPEEQIQGEIWLWHRRALNVTYGGLILWQGKNRHQLQAKCINIRSSAPTPADITDGTYPTGLRLQVIEPLKKVRLSLDDKEQETSFDVELTAIMPPAFRANSKKYTEDSANWGYSGGHYSQAMRTKGSLSLEGKDYKVDGFFTRDRSWGETRGEGSTNYPTIGWFTGVFDENFAFHVYGFDEQPADWQEKNRDFVIPPGVRWGYVWINGVLRGVKDAKIFSDIDVEKDFYPKGFEIHILDSEDESHQFKGTVEACQPYTATSQLWSYYFAVRWEYKGRLGWGNSQYALWHKYFKKLLPGSRG